MPFYLLVGTVLDYPFFRATFLGYHRLFSSNLFFLFFVSLLFASHFFLKKKKNRQEWNTELHEIQRYRKVLPNVNWMIPHDG